MNILMLDIETSPHLVMAWGLFDQNISIDQIESPGYTLCWAAKWHGKKQVLSAWHTERHFLTSIHALLRTADAVCTFNGNKFDLPTLNREFVLNGLDPVSVPSIDLYKVVRGRFKFASNKLDYVSKQLGLGCKVKHRGMQMWRDCMAGSIKARKEMLVYNKQDVVLLELLFNKLTPWLPGAYGYKTICKNLGIGQ